MKATEIQDSFDLWLEDNGLTMGDFQDWYAKKFLKVPIGMLRRLIGKMNKIADDERLGPNRRMLAAYQSAYWSAKIIGDAPEQALLASVILGEFVNRNGFKLIDAQGSPLPPEGRDRSIVEIGAMNNLKEAFSVMRVNLQKEGFIPNDTTTTTTVQG